MTTLNPISPFAQEQGNFAWEIATLYPEQGRWTDDAYFDLTEHTHRLIELRDGQLEFLPRPNRSHQRIAAFLFSPLKVMIDGKGLGEVLFTGIRVKTRKGYREPDLAALLIENDGPGNERAWRTADLCVEIVSPGGERRDLFDKRLDYAGAGVAEYWIVDPQARRIAVLTLKDGEYVTHSEATSGVVSSALLAGLTCDVDVCFAAAEK